MFATWWLFIMILTSFYTANLTAFLTLSRFTLPIQTIEDIAKPAHRWIAVEGGSIDYAVKVDNGLASLKHSYNRGRGKFVDTADTLQIKSLIAEGVLFLHDRDWLNFFMLQIERSITNEKEHCKFVLTTKSYLSRSLSFVFPKHSHLPNLFNPVMLSYVESGIIKHLLTKELPEAIICPLNLGNKEQKLHNSDLLTTYAVVIAGFSVATAVFISELLSRFWSRWRSCANIQPANLQNTKRYTNKFLSRKTKSNLTSNLPENIVYVNGRNYTFSRQPNQLKLIPERQLSSFLFQHIK